MRADSRTSISVPVARRHSGGGASCRGQRRARVIVVGVRLGLPLAAEALAGEPLAALVAWAPIVNGKRYVRELKVLQRITDAAAAGTIAIGGFSYPRGCWSACLP